MNCVLTNNNIQIVIILEEEIDKEALLGLNESLVLPLLPKVGLRAKLLTKIAELKKVSIDCGTVCNRSDIQKKKIQSLLSLLCCSVMLTAITGETCSRLNSFAAELAFSSFSSLPNFYLVTKQSKAFHTAYDF